MPLPPSAGSAMLQHDAAGDSAAAAAAAGVLQGPDAAEQSSHSAGSSNDLLVLNRDQMMAIKQKFEGADGLSLQEFVLAFASVFPGKSIKELTYLHMKIDANSDGTVDWDEFTDYIIHGDSTKESGHQQSVRGAGRQRQRQHVSGDSDADQDVIGAGIKFVTSQQLTQQHLQSTSHHHTLPITCVTYLDKYHQYVTGSKDGTLKLWNANNMQYVRTITFGISWVNALTYLPSSDLLVACGMDRHIAFFDLTAVVVNELLPVGRVKGMASQFLSQMSSAIKIIPIHSSTSSNAAAISESSLLTSTPVCMDVCTLVQQHQNQSSAVEYLLLGDDAGNIAVWKFTAPYKWHICDGMSGLSCKCTPHSLHWSKGVTLTILQSLHAAAITRITYDHRMNMILTSSLDGTVKVTDLHKIDSVDVNPRRTYEDSDDSKELYSFSYSHKFKLLAACGLGRKLVLWSTYSSQRYQLAGHHSAVQHVVFDDEQNILISLDMTNVVHIFDISVVNEGKCLQTIVGGRPSDAYSGSGHLPIHPRSTHSASSVTRPSALDTHFSTMHYHHCLHRLLLASSTLHVYQSKPKTDVGMYSHPAPVVSALHNHSFHQVVSCDTSGIVSVWDLETGVLVYRFHTHHAITAMCFDTQQRRIVIGTHYGEVAIYNFSNGQCLSELIGRSVSQEDIGSDRSNEVTALLYMLERKASSQQKYVVSVGWQREAQVWRDTGDSVVPFIYTMPRRDGQALDDSIAASNQSSTASPHTDDILCLTMCGTSVLATASYDGAICLWNFDTAVLVTTLTLPAQARADANTSTRKPSAEKHELSVNAMLYVTSGPASHSHSNAHLLLTAHSDGYLRWWDIRRYQYVAQAKLSDHSLTVLKQRVDGDAADDSDGMSFAIGDSQGHVYVCNIHLPDVQPRSSQARPIDHEPWLHVQTQWSAHPSHPVTSIDYLSPNHPTMDLAAGLTTALQGDFILTASNDCTIILWSIDGLKIGMFGQPAMMSGIAQRARSARCWDLTDRSTWIGWAAVQRQQQLREEAERKKRIDEENEAKMAELRDGRPRLVWRMAAAAALAKQEAKLRKQQPYKSPRASQLQRTLTFAPHRHSLTAPDEKEQPNEDSKLAPALRHRPSLRAAAPVNIDAIDLDAIVHSVPPVPQPSSRSTLRQSMQAPAQHTPNDPTAFFYELARSTPPAQHPMHQLAAAHSRPATESAQRLQPTTMHSTHTQALSISNIRQRLTTSSLSLPPTAAQPSSGSAATACAAKPNSRHSASRLQLQTYALDHVPDLE